MENNNTPQLKHLSMTEDGVHEMSEEWSAGAQYERESIIGMVDDALLNPNMMSMSSEDSLGFLKLALTMRGEGV